MKEFIKVMKALSDPNRVKIVKLLERRSLCVCELQEALRIAQSTVSKHLRVLEEAGLVSYSKEGQWINYQLDTHNPYATTILKNLKEWLNEDPEIAGLIEKLPEINRERILKKRSKPN